MNLRKRVKNLENELFLLRKQLKCNHKYTLGRIYVGSHRTNDSPQVRGYFKCRYCFDVINKMLTKKEVNAAKTVGLL